MKKHIFIGLWCLVVFCCFGQTISKLEYFINTDPGFGNATSVTQSSNTDNLTQTFNITIPNTLSGFNTLYIRSQDSNGIWSLYDQSIFFVSEVTSNTNTIAAAEYFFNTDPGFGNGTAFSIPSGTNAAFTESFQIAIPNTLAGFNTLYVRTQDNNGTWSLYDQRLFFVRDNGTALQVTVAEYFYDTDPGFGNGTAATLTPTSNPNEFTVELATTDVACGLHDYYIRLRNNDGTWSLYDFRTDLDIFDNASPTINVFENITASLDATGNATITIDDVNDGTTDDCDLVSIALNQSSFTYNCANLGENTVTVTAIDAEDKISTLDVTITVVDNIDPVASSQNITVQLDNNGTISVTPQQIDNGSSDNCSVVSLALSETSFTCDNVGQNTVTLTVTDTSGNTNTSEAIITVQDVTRPTIVTKNITATLDNAGVVTITPQQVNNNSFDNCAIASLALDKTNFTCANVGENTVILTATDINGNSDTATAIITVEDTTKPIVLTSPIALSLNSNGAASITANSIDNGSSDACGITNLSLDKTAFTCDDMGQNTVTLTVTDNNGNSESKTVVVTISDNTDPVAIAQNITVPLGSNGTISVTAQQVNNGSSDNCTISSFMLNKTSFTCDNIGQNTVTLTVTDSSGNTDTTTAIVTIEDTTKPTVLTNNITVELDNTGETTITPQQVDNSSFDNCSIASLGLSKTTFTCDDLGTNTVTLTVTDSNENIESNTATVTVIDNLAPMFIEISLPTDTEVTADLSNEYTVADFRSGILISDNCKNFMFEDIIQSPAIGSVLDSQETPYTVTLTITDSSNNTLDTHNFQLTVKQGPTLSTQEIINSETISFTFYPNPAKDWIKIDTEVNFVEIIDVSGKTVIVSKESLININVLPSGVYFIKVNINGNTDISRLIKQ